MEHYCDCRGGGPRMCIGRKSILVAFLSNSFAVVNLSFSNQRMRYECVPTRVEQHVTLSSKQIRESRVCSLLKAYVVNFPKNRHTARVHFRIAEGSISRMIRMYPT
jgi:hypothetical protein